MLKTLQDKIAESVALIRKAEHLALALQPEQGFHVGFSGGKDSQVLLALVKMAGVKYRAVYNVTTNDPPENVYFIRKHYPDVEFEHQGKNLYRLIEKKGFPTIFHRWCCEIFKEEAGAGSVVLTGVRREESKKRAGYKPVDVKSNRKEHLERKDPYTIEGIEAAGHQCIKGKDKIMVYPMLEWTTTDVWVFIAKEHLPVNPCYEHGGRVGCMFCPYASKEQIDYYETRYPKFHGLFMEGLSSYLSKRETIDKNFDSVEEYYEWWKSKKSVKAFLREKRRKAEELAQLKLF